MDRNKFIANRLREVFLDGKWIANTNYKEQLENTSVEKAITKINNINTIAQLTFHINYYLEGLIQVLQGGPLDIKDKYSFDCPAALSDDEWQNMIFTLLQNATIFSNKVELLNDETLDKCFVDEKYGSYERNIEAVIEHSYYHLGQIVMIGKMIELKNIK